MSCCERIKVAILLNPKSGQNRHCQFLKQLPSFLMSKGLETSFSLELKPDRSYDTQAQEFVEQSRCQGIDHLIAVGGDGTVNLLAHTLTSLGEDCKETFLGAIGTGSSNDFHKPIQNSYCGIPYRLDFQRTVQSDLVTVITEKERYCFLNSFGMGFIADANFRFNNPSFLLKALKKLSVPSAIAYTAFTQLFRLESKEILAIVDGTATKKIAFTNLNLAKNPFISGSFRYEKTVEIDDGYIAFHLIEPCSTLHFIGKMISLLKGRFVGERGTYSTKIRKIIFKDPLGFCFEVDGEVHSAKYVEIAPLPNKIQLAS